ncbi:MAG: hypothetical protein JWO81_2599 [Alphaproteobacteria bacterium]|nr:hypothetical protein [Alphaproteobacteria bacterium]
MTDAGQATDRDIDYLRQLAESGAHAPLLGGRFLTWWGLLLTIAYAVHHLALHRVIGDGNTIFAFIWIGFSVIGVGGQFVLARTIRRKAGSGSAGNRASRVVWVAGACSIVSMIVGSVIAANTGAGTGTFDWSVPVAFAVYASALIVTGSLARNRVALAAGGAAVLMVGLFTAMILSPDRYLLASAGVALTVLLPGLLLLRSEPR